VIDVRWQPATSRASRRGRLGATRAPAGGSPRRRWASAVGGIVLLAPAGCGTADDDDETGSSGRVPAVELVGPDEFAERVADPEAVVVNVHVPGQPEPLGWVRYVVAVARPSFCSAPGSSLRELTPSLVKTLARWYSTVRGLM
jgi:hypothetical protein